MEKAEEKNSGWKKQCTSLYEAVKQMVCFEMSEECFLGTIGTG